MFHVLKNNSLAVSFYGWNRIEAFMQAWKSAGFRIVGHLVFTKTYASKSAFCTFPGISSYWHSRSYSGSSSSLTAPDPAPQRCTT